jgi:dihydrofolate reductase
MITLIAAVDKNFAIGKVNTIPWHLPADFAHFKETTMGHPVIMGHTTYLSIGKPLPGRFNVVLADKDAINGCVVAHSLKEAFAKASENDDTMFVIGGASVYAQALSFADRVILTHIDTEVEGADTFFPRLDVNEWKEVSCLDRPSDDKNCFKMSFITYERRK